MWIWIVGSALLVIAAGVAIWFFVSIRRSGAALQAAPMFYRCTHCGMPFIPRSSGSHLPTCTNCGCTTNISGQTPFSADDINHEKWLKSLDRSKPETWLVFAAELEQQGRFGEALECLQTIADMPDVDEATATFAAGWIENLRRRGH